MSINDLNQKKVTLRSFKIFSSSQGHAVNVT